MICEKTYGEDLLAVGDVHGRDTLFVASHELWVLLKEHLEALSVPVLANHVAGRVAIEVLGVEVGTLDEQCLQDLGVATDACYVQRCAQILRLAIDIGVELGKDLDHLDVTLVTSDVERCPSIRVALVKESLGQLWLLLQEELVALLKVSLLSVNPDVTEQAPLLLLIEFALGLDPGGPLLLLELLP